MMGLPANPSAANSGQHQQQNATQPQQTGSNGTQPMTAEEARKQHDANVVRSLLGGIMATGGFGGGGRKRTAEGNGVSLGSEEWARKRKDNHVNECHFGYFISDISRR